MTLSELLVSIQTSVILFPIHLVFGRLFQLVHPPEVLPPLPLSQAACPSVLVRETPSLTQVVKVSRCRYIKYPPPSVWWKRVMGDFLGGSQHPGPFDVFSLIPVHCVVISYSLSFLPRL